MRIRQRPNLQIRISLNQHLNLLIRRRRRRHPGQTIHARDIQVLIDSKPLPTAERDIWYGEVGQQVIVGSRVGVRV